RSSCASRSSAARPPTRRIESMHERRWTRSAAALLSILALLAAPGSTTLARAQAPSPAPPAPPVFGTQTAAVLVDVVVRDKKGRLVRDLTAADFTILEDGAPQTVESLRLFDAAP